MEGLRAVSGMDRRNRSRMAARCGRYEFERGTVAQLSQQNPVGLHPHARLQERDRIVGFSRDQVNFVRVIWQQQLSRIFNCDDALMLRDVLDDRSGECSFPYTCLTTDDDVLLSMNGFSEEIPPFTLQLVLQQHPIIER